MSHVESIIIDSKITNVCHRFVSDVGQEDIIYSIFGVLIKEKGDAKDAKYSPSFRGDVSVPHKLRNS